MPRIITVGVPAHNEETTIADTIAHLRRQKLPKGTELEIIVGANACTDRTHDIVEAISREDERVKLLRIPERGKPNAVNSIKREALGDLVFFCDADTRVEEEAVSKLLSVLDSRPDVDAVSVVPMPLRLKNRNLVEIMASASRAVHANKRISQLSAGKVLEGIHGSFYCIRKDKLPEIPREIRNEDSFLSRVLGGSRIAMVPSVNVRTRVPLSLSDFIRQGTRHTMGRLQLKSLGYASSRTPGLTFVERTLPRRAYYKGLPLSEKVLWFPAVLVRLYAGFKGIRSFGRSKNVRRQRDKSGWTPSKRR